MTARAFARTTDPVSSWEAAESLPDDVIRASQKLVLSYIRSVGRAFIKEVEDALEAPLPGRSRARIRTAVKELRDLGHLEIADYGHPPWSAKKAMILQPTRKEE